MAIDNKTLDTLMHAFLDGQLSPNATKKIINYLKGNPARSTELKLNKKVKTYLQGAYEPILEIPISNRLQSILIGEPSQLATASGISVDAIDFDLQNQNTSDTAAEEKSTHTKSKSWREILSASIHNHAGHIVLLSSLVFMIGLVIGYLYPRMSEPDQISKREFSENLALSAHLAYTDETEFSEQTKPKNLSSFTESYTKKMGADISPVNLDSIGLELMGGLVLPSLNEKAIFYMYRSVSNERLSLYIRKHFKKTGTSNFNCFSSPTNQLNICSWRGNKLTYFVVSDQPADTMKAIVQDISTRLTN